MDGDRATGARICSTPRTAHDAWLMNRTTLMPLGVINGGHGSGVDASGRSLGVPVADGNTLQSRLAP